MTPIPHAQLTSLPDDVLARMLAFAAPRDVEAVAVASKAVALHVLPRFPIWKRIFCDRWAILNFPLGGIDEERDATEVEVDPRLRAQFTSSCSESRMYQMLAHAITPVPSYVDIRATMQYRREVGFGMMEHTIAHLNRDLSVCTLNPRRGCGARAVDIAFTGQFPGGNRSVRANTSFPPTFRVQVYKQRIPHTDSRFKYQVGVTASGYFEVTIAQRKQEQQQRQSRVSGSDLTSIGVGTDRFCLVGKQPGWDRHSYGYHGDDGQYYHKTGYGHPFGSPFDTGDTVGCGVRRNMQTLKASLFFTNNGELIPAEDGGMECGLGEWYPLVGLDSPHAIHFNFGQEPFRYDVADEFYKESEGVAGLLANQLQWYTISDSDGETSDSEDDGVMGESDADESNFDDEDDDEDDEMFDAEFVDEHFLELHGVYHDLDDLDAFYDYYDGDADDTESELEFEEDDDEASMDET